MNRSVRVFLACFCGAFIGALIALKVNLDFWWLGLLVGGLTGYMTYDFKQVMVMVPKAFKLFKQVLLRDCAEELDLIRAYLKPSHAFSHIALVLLGIIFALLLSAGEMRIDADADGKFFKLLGLAVGFLSVTPIFFMFFYFLIAGLAFLGARYMEKVYWYPYSETKIRARSIAIDLDKAGLQMADINYRNAFRWVVKGSVYAVWFSFKFIFWLGWKFLFLGIYYTAKAIFVGTRYLFKTIHSDMRLLCGIDAALGALIGFYFENPVLGAVIGGLIGVLNYELISKRLLRLVTATKAS
ncbi:hypothetical protein C4546_01175 [Candidatus Parcubacteria bacterium]|jgi:uncharacterized protein YqgC (DUF456 family)|nr:MAG: hypothetical protein C4546_01175 [Candidatus Parcubacteria bacterium]